MLAVLLTIARVDRVVSSTGGKIVSVDAPLVLQALDPSIVKSIDVREGEVVEQDRLLAALDPTFAVADVHQLRVQIDSLNAQITREEAELAHKAPDFLTTSDPSSQRYEVLQKALFDQRAAQYSAQLEGFDQKIARRKRLSINTRMTRAATGTGLASLKRLRACAIRWRNMGMNRGSTF